MKPHLRKVQLTPTPEVVVTPTWLQLAGQGYRVDNVAHLATLALRMSMTVDDVRRRLGAAYRVIGNPDRRVAHALDIACDIVQVRRHNIRVPAKGTRPQRFTSEFQNGHKLGLMEPPRPDEFRQMAREKVVDEGDSLRRRTLEEEAKQYRKRHGTGQDPNWHMLPRSAMRDVPRSADSEIALTMRISTDEHGEVVALQEAA